MKILYGVQTTGHGHLVRARQMAPGLRDLGHQLHAMLSGPPPDPAWTAGLFERFDYHPGFTFQIAAGRIRYLQTGRRLYLRRFLTDVRSFDAAGFDLVISDFEPLSAYIAKIHGIPSIGLGHLYAFCYRVPTGGFNPLAGLLWRYFAPVRHPLGFHWHHFDQPLLPPAISRDVRSAETFRPDKILLYLPFENQGVITRWLADFPDYQFYLYTDVAQASDHGHLHFRPFSRAGFLRDLGECAGVISHAGFTLTSEALHLGKKVLVRPLKGQFEQAANTAALLRLGLGSLISRLDEETLSDWLERPPISPLVFPDVTPHVVRWIDAGNWDRIGELAEGLWAVMKRNPV